MDKIKVKYHNPICTIEKIRVGDWIDLKVPRRSKFEKVTAQELV